MAILSNLQSREKKALVSMFAALSLFAAVQFVLFPLLDRRETLERQISAAERNLGEMEILRARYYDLLEKSTAGDKVAHGKDFSLFSLMEEIADRSGIKDNITYIKPSTSERKGTSYKTAIVEIRLETIAMNQLILFLYNVEASETKANVGRMSISKTSNPEGFVNAVIQVETLLET